MVQAPTGFGKTMVAATIARRDCELARARSSPSRRSRLIDQTVEKFYAEGIRDIGVIQANHQLTELRRPVQVASVQTLCAARRCRGRHRHDRRGAPLVRFLRRMAAQVRGRTCRSSGCRRRRGPGLGKHFDKLIIGSPRRELIEAGYLSKFRVFAPASPDLTGVRTVAGDYHEGDLAEGDGQGGAGRRRRRHLAGRGEDRPTLCFAVDRAHAKHLQQKFSRPASPAGYIDAYTDADERKEIARQFHAGEIKVVCNVGCLTTGIDWDVRCIILARPTKSEMLFVQMIGRGLADRRRQGRLPDPRSQRQPHPARLRHRHPPRPARRRRRAGRRPNRGPPRSCRRSAPSARSCGR